MAPKKPAGPRYTDDNIAPELGAQKPPRRKPGQKAPAKPKEISMTLDDRELDKMLERYRQIERKGGKGKK
jgi:hypothetical protein